MQTEPAIPRKMDRRTIYTRKTVKDALLELLEKHPYEKITVASLCRQAEITRATFYLHFQDMDAVLNELLDEALMVAEAASNEMSMSERMSALEQITNNGTAGELQLNERFLGPCQRVADDPKYRAIFQDPTLSGYVINRIYRLERDEMVPFLMRRCHLDQGMADKLFMTIVYGLFYMNRSLQWKKDKDWYEMQMVFNRFMFSGFDALHKRDNAESNSGYLKA